MTVDSQTTFVVANGNDSADTFSFSPIVVFDADDIVVTKQDALGVQTVIAQGTTGDTWSAIVSGDYPQTGSVKYPNTGTKLATGEKLRIERVLELTQPTDLDNEGGYFAETQEQTFDRLCYELIQCQHDVNVTTEKIDTILATLGFTLSLDVNEDITTGGALTGYARVDEDTQWQKRVTGKTPVALSDGASVAFDMSQGNFFTWTLTNSGHTLTNPGSTHRNGDSGYLYIKQNGTGGWTPAFGDHYKLIGFVAGDLNTTANAVNCVSYAVENDFVCLFFGGSYVPA